MSRRGYGWAGTTREFLELSRNQWVAALSEHHQTLMNQGVASVQLDAWTEEHDLMARSLKQCVAVQPQAADWGLVFEFELPLEGGRRPDVVVLSGGSLSILEFKSTTRPVQPQIDQVAAYGRDLSEYHEATHGRKVQSILVLPRAEPSLAQEVDKTLVSGGEDLWEYLCRLAEPNNIDLQEWLEAPYAPLPTLTAAARRIFEHEKLPHVRRALAAGIPETLDLLEKIVLEASERGERVAAFVTGVPGAGKTLVGLRFVYERASDNERAILLSGNGPLVSVLQDALKSREFVRDLHAFITTYGLKDRPPKEHVVVFDEAQRAWDAGFMEEKKGVPHSESDLLVGIGERIPKWSALIGLVGEGQHIFSGEEGGMPQWRQAFAGSQTNDWHVHCPPHLAPEFEGLSVTKHPRLHLEVAVRSRRAEDIHDWVRLLLEGSLPLAARQALRFFNDQFQMYVTRDIREAKAYTTSRYVGEPEARYGLLASSHANAPLSHGFDNSFLATRKIKIGPWFNADQGDPWSCCALDQPVTEFQCQGLELDLPILIWGEDLLWDGKSWMHRPKRRKYPIQDAEGVLKNCYRVLLTRGRDGFLVWLPPEERFDLTEHALLAAGLRPLEKSSSPSGRSAVGDAVS